MITANPQYTTKRICSLMVTHSCNLHCVYCFEKYKSKGLKFMSLNTAQKILNKEFEDFSNKDRLPSDRLAIEFFGGEPLLNFDLIQNIYEWTDSLNLTFPLIFQLTTNGTLFTDNMLHWFAERIEGFRIVVSIDGDDYMQYINRGCDFKKIPIDYIAKNWKNSYFKMTVSQETLPYYSKGIIDLSLKGYKVPSSLAEGIVWNQEDATIYKNELMKIARFYLKHPEFEPDQPFDYSFSKLLSPLNIPPKNCGVGTDILIYDTDGISYPCHLFLPIVHGQNEVERILKDIDFHDDASLINDKCRKCLIPNICRTCYGYNQIDRGNPQNRNLSKCKMQLAEAQVISSFQIQYYIAKKEHLTANEVLKLKAAIKCYELVHNNVFNFN